MLCPFIVNSNTIELAVHTSCYYVLDLLCVIKYAYVCTLRVYTKICAYLKKNNHIVVMFPLFRRNQLQWGSK